MKSKSELPTYTLKYQLYRPCWLLWLVQTGRYLLQKTDYYWDDPTYGNGGGSWEIGTWTIAKFHSFEKAKTELNKLKILNRTGQERRWHPDGNTGFNY